MLLDLKESRMEPDITVIHVSGRLAPGRESLRIEGLVEGFAAQGRLKMILDLAQVDYIDSAESACWRWWPAEGRAKNLLHFTQMDVIVPLSATLEEAAAGFVPGRPLPPAAA